MQKTRPDMHAAPWSSWRGRQHRLPVGDGGNPTLFGIELLVSSGLPPGSVELVQPGRPRLRLIQGGKA
jgi:hypothetical protein